MRLDSGSRSSPLAHPTAVRAVGLGDGDFAGLRGRRLGSIDVRPGGGHELDVQHDAVHGRASLVDAGYTGKGVDVAVIDTGVSPVAGLDTPRQARLRARPLARVPGAEPAQPGHVRARHLHGRPDRRARRALHGAVRARPGLVYRGMAPDARIVSLKVAYADGGTDVSQVIAAIDWVVQHANDNGLNIRVINLSYGTNSPQEYESTRSRMRSSRPGRRASSSSRPPATPATSTARAPWPGRPGVQPVRDRRRRLGLDGHGDDRRRRRSARTRRARCGTLQEPGLRRARAPTCRGCACRTRTSTRRTRAASIDDRYFRGSGTSQATAIAAGAVALVLQKNPDADTGPGQALLPGSGQPLAGSSRRLRAKARSRSRKMLSRRPSKKSEVHDSTARARSSSPAAATTSPTTASCSPASRTSSATLRRSDVDLGRPAGVCQRQQLERQHLVGQQLERQHLVGQQLERHQLVREQLERQQLVREQLERQQLVGQQLERQLVERRQLVDRLLGLKNRA